jgi:hypothetical protein
MNYFAGNDFSLNRLQMPPHAGVLDAPPGIAVSDAPGNFKGFRISETIQTPEEIFPTTSRTPAS